MADHGRVTRSMVKSLDSLSNVKISTKGKKRTLSDATRTVPKRIKRNESRYENIGAHSTTAKKIRKPNVSGSARPNTSSHDRAYKRNTQNCKSETSKMQTVKTRSRQDRKHFGQADIKASRSAHPRKPKGKKYKETKSNSSSHSKPQHGQSFKTGILRTMTKHRKNITIHTETENPIRPKGRTKRITKIKTSSKSGTARRSHSKGTLSSNSISKLPEYPHPADTSFILDRKETFKLWKIQKGYSSCNVWSMCILASGDILITDAMNVWLKRVDCVSHEIVSCIALSSTAHSICKVNETDAVVALSNKSIQFVSAGDGLVTTRSLKLNHLCLGVCVISDNLYVTDGCGRNIYIYDLDGNLLKQVGGADMFSWNRFMTASDNMDALYVTDKDRGVVKLCPTGEVIWSFEPQFLKGAYGICTDGSGNVIATGYVSRNVVLISSTGKLLKEIVSSKECMPQTTGVCFDRKRRKLYVTGYHDDFVHVYYFK